MKIDKTIRAMPWPEPFHGTDTQGFRITAAFPVIDHQQMMVLTFTGNENRAIRRIRDFRLICAKKQPAAVVLYKGETKGRRHSLGKACGYYVRTEYPEISPREEKALARWLGITKTNNHCLMELDVWVEQAIAAERKRERAAKGELEDIEVYDCPEELPEGLEDFVRRKMLPEDYTLIYQTGNVRGTCFVCGRQVRARGKRFKQNYTVRCPDCGSEVTCYKNTSDAYKARYVGNVATIQKGADGRTIYIRQWHLLRDHSAAWEDIPGQLQEIVRYAIRGIHAAKWQKEAKEQFMFGSRRYELDSWRRMNNVAEIYDGFYYFYCPETWEDVLNGTSLQYCSLGEYMRSPERIKNTIRFLLDWARYPLVEKLWKAGYTMLVHDRVTGRMTRETRNAINWNKDVLSEGFHFPTRLLKIRCPEEWAIKDVERVTQIWRMVSTGCLRETELAELALSEVPVEIIKDAIGHATVYRILKYINQAGISQFTYRDYLHECVLLHLDLDDQAVLFPKNLYDAHQRTAAQVEYNEKRINKEKFAAQVRRLAWMAWEKDGLLIRLPMDAAELIKEGAHLHHCVGGYAQRMADGKTIILLIRRTSDPDTPFYTLEWTGSYVQQCRTIRNRDYRTDPQVRDFVQAWADMVNKRKKRSKTA